MDIPAASHVVQTPLSPVPATGSSEQRANARDAQTRQAVRAPEDKAASPHAQSRKPGAGVDITV
ncbi:MAG: hypothetical protein D6782_03270 [Alphaproteobacteria bacterium]|nr:MAG: hypothetical protein D6782_03270 [Alphaproteobacteria bacterium]